MKVKVTLERLSRLDHLIRNQSNICQIFVMCTNLSKVPKRRKSHDFSVELGSLTFVSIFRNLDAILEGLHKQILNVAFNI